MMPIEQAIAVNAVRPFFVRTLEKELFNAVKKDIELFLFCIEPVGVGAFSVEIGRLSETTSPSFMRMMRSAYCSASSSLWVTMMTRRSLPISLIRSKTCTDVTESKAPVGSSAKMISGSFAKARAIATRCIWPPESWLGRFLATSSKPTRFKTSIAFSLLSFSPFPLKRRPVLTLERTVSWGIRL